MLLNSIKVAKLLVLNLIPHQPSNSPFSWQKYSMMKLLFSKLIRAKQDPLNQKLFPYSSNFHIQEICSKLFIVL